MPPPRRAPPAGAQMPDLPRVYPPPKPEDWCAQWLAQLTKASADADAEHARATATWRERSAYWAMQHPLLTNDYARPAIGGGKRPKLALSWAFPASAQLGASGARWAPSKSGYAFSAHEAFELAAVADLILTAAEESGFDPGHDVLIVSRAPLASCCGRAGDVAPGKAAIRNEWPCSWLRGRIAHRCKRLRHSVPGPRPLGPPGTGCLMRRANRHATTCMEASR